MHIITQHGDRRLEGRNKLGWKLSLSQSGTPVLARLYAPLPWNHFIFEWSSPIHFMHLLYLSMSLNKC